VRTCSSLSQTFCPSNSPDLNTVNLLSGVLFSRRSTIIKVFSVDKMKRAIVKCVAETTAWRSHCQFTTLIAFLFSANVIRQMAPLFCKVDSNKLRLDVQNEETAIFAKFGKDLFNISKVIGCKTKWPRFLAYPVDTLDTYSYSKGATC